MQPSVVVFDVNETLSDLAPLDRRFVEVGAPASMATLWFTTVLRDGFALTAAGAGAPFADLAAGALRTLLDGVALSVPTAQAVEHVMAGFDVLPVHPDVPDGIRALDGLRLVTLSNGSIRVAERLLTAAGIRERFERLLSVEDAGVWKPAAPAYAYAATACGVAPGDMVLVAVHPWDIDGAVRAGLRTAWLNRAADTFPGYFREPDRTITALTGLADCLAP